MRHSPTIHLAAILFLFSSVYLAPSVSATENWPQWRGPQGDGHYAGKLPEKWDDSNVVWKTQLEGRGHSSPCIWEDKIFLTSALENGRQRVVMCLDRKTGQRLWRKVVWTGEPEKAHRMNEWASSTCATDGERVIAFFGRGGLHCFDLNGKQLWSRDFGDFPNPWGVASSPIIVDDLVVQNCEAEENSFLLAADTKTGETKWKTPRPKQRGWSTPLLVQVDKRRELVINGEKGINAYDLASGKDLWFCKGDRGRGTPSVVNTGKLIVAVSGRPGDMFATRPGGAGDVNDTHEAWRTPRRAGRDLGSPIALDQLLGVISYRPGIAACYDGASGAELARKRLSGNVCASPIAANDLVYVPNESGEVFVIRFGKNIEVVARNQVTAGEDEIFRSSLGASHGQVFLRSDRAIYCIGP